jgi:acyl-lipid omega-6 desaturase (Delta-12 desaturase)
MMGTNFERPARKTALEDGAFTRVRESVRVFAREDRARTSRLLATTILALVSCFFVAAMATYPLLGIVSGVVLGLLQLRLFAFYHDTMHGAIFSDSHAGRLLMRLAGMYLLTPPSVWRETHDFHHRHNAMLSGSQIGSFPIVTRKTWHAMTARQKLAYRIKRHPLNMLFGYITVFIVGMNLAPFSRNPARHWTALVALVAHVALFAAVAWVTTPLNAFCAVVLPMLVSTSIGSYLFFAQHNFPDEIINTRDQWDYTEAALFSSSMFEMGAVMHWITGNIGYHHVHHLNSRIPFYRLDEAMASIPELHNPGKVTWSIRDMSACLRIGAWDPQRGRALRYSELRECNQGLDASC